MNNKKQNAVSFGAKGWWVIIYSILAFFLEASLNSDGTNVLAPAYSASLGLPEGTIYSLIGWAGLVGVVIHIILGQVIKRIGPKRTLCVAFLLGAVGMLIESFSTTAGIFFLGRCLLNGALTNASFMGCAVLCANWFPKRKGLVMGYTTWGLNICSLVGVALLSVCISMGGLRLGMLPYVIAFAVMGILALVTLKDDPMEAGQYPDNVSKEVYEAEYSTASLERNTTGWTTKKLLGNGYLWLVGITTGACNIGTGILITNMVSRNVELGMSQTGAIACMSLVAVIGIVGSWLVGVIDEKLGTKKTLLGFSIWYLIGVLFNVAASFTTGGLSTACLYISIFMIGVGVGGSANFTSSLPISVFGRHSFDMVNSVIFPIQAATIACNFLISGLIRTVTNNDLKFVFLAGGAVWIIVFLLTLLLKDEFKYNDDMKAERAAKQGK